NKMEFFEMKDEKGVDVPVADNTVSMLNVTSFYGGLHFRSIIDLVAETDYGKKKAGGTVDFFIDFMFAPILNFSDVKNKNGDVYDFDAKKENKKRLGWRAG